MSFVYMYIVDGAIIGMSGSPQLPMNGIEWVKMSSDDPDVLQWMDSRRPTPEALAQAKRDSLLAAAAIRIAPLQDAADIGQATEAEAAKLIAWKNYRMTLSRITEQPGFPDAIEWPVEPA